MSSTVEPFRLTIDQALLDDLRRRLDNTRWPDEIEAGSWRYGTDLAYLKSLCESWKTFDWRAVEAQLNSWEQITTVIDGQQVHALHARSPEPDALPLIITHGWPGSIIEFFDVIEPLRNPLAHGGTAQQAFHLVIPSIPGYGLSGPTSEPGWHVGRVAEAWKELMARLGYSRYGAQGGDWGSLISTALATIDAEHMCGLHLNFPVAGRTDDELSDLEQDDLRAAAAFRDAGTAYQQIQGKNPQTLAYGLSDSPVGLAGWIVEKFHHWTHHPDGDLETAVSRDKILANLTLYWLTGTINSSTRLYYESMHSDMFRPAQGRVSVPTGCAIFPGEITRAPRAWIASKFNLTHFNRFERGGHFAALEEPDLFIADLRAFFDTVR